MFKDLFKSLNVLIKGVFLKEAKKDGNQEPRPEKGQKLEKEGLEKEGLKKEMAELKETLQRTQAEFENSRKRLEKEKQDFVKVAEAGLVKELLPVLDSIGSAKDDEGIPMIKKQLLAVLEKHGLGEIKSFGQKFDPMLHECVMQGKEPEKEDEIVLEEFQKGYLFNGMVLRHAKVKVNKL